MSYISPRDGPYSIVSRGVNEQGSRHCELHYSNYAATQNSYCYTNTDGSYYYSNPNGSTYYNNGNDYSSYTSPSGGGWVSAYPGAPRNPRQ